MYDLIAYKKNIIDKFKQHNIDVSEVNILFMEALNLSKLQLLQKSSLTNSEKKIIDKCIKKRLKGMPIQKIFKRAYFYGLEFYINKNVLCPRPETELLVEEVLSKNGKDILDLCTGSGAIAISVANNTHANITASDISRKALFVAQKNAKKHNLQIQFVKSNLFNNIKGQFDIIVSNPPYIPSKDCLNLDVEVKNFDPKISLDGGADGLDFYRQIAIQSKRHLKVNGYLILEVGFDQANAVKNILLQNGFACYGKNDYNGIERIVVGELKW